MQLFYDIDAQYRNVSSLFYLVNAKFMYSTLNIDAD